MSKLPDEIPTQAREIAMARGITMEELYGLPPLVYQYCPAPYPLPVVVRHWEAIR